MSGAGRAVGLIAGALALSACAIGPDYRRPELPTTPSFRDWSEDQASIADLPWWEVFRDEALQALVREGLESNRDLLAAQSRVEEAGSLAAVQRGRLFPSVGYEATAARGEGTNFASSAPGLGAENSFLGALDAAWELDIWGRIRRASEASRAEMLASEAFRRGVVLSLVAGIAQAYFELRELDLELEIAMRTVANFSETFALFERQYRGGVTSRLDPLRAEAALAQAAAAVPDLEGRIVAKENELSVRIGRPPGAVPRGASLLEQVEPPEIPAGVPSQLLERRPDLLEAEQTLVAANARIGEALANFFPRIGLTSLYGGESTELEDLLNSSAGIWSAAVSTTGPIFTFGRTWYFWKASQANTEVARRRYEQTVLVALQEVSDALTAREKLAEVRREQERAVASLEQSVSVARSRYLGGFATYLEVLDAQEKLFPAETALARTRRDELLTLVTLYRVLGGGWSEAPPAPAVPLPLAP